MPGRNPAEAVNNYIEPLQQSLSCFSKAIILTTGVDEGILHTATPSLAVIEVITSAGEVLNLFFAQWFSVEKRSILPGYKIRTRYYNYRLENEEHKEIISYHWHPEAETLNNVEYPHLHIGPGAAYRLRDEFHKIHIRTDRMAFEDFCLILLRDFKVQPDRDRAEDILNDNLHKFRSHRSWSAW